MAKSHLKVANVVASSSETAWSQTYHAGGVTAVVCVRATKESADSPSLSIVGKDLLNTFESEYFTLETKNLASIKSAVETTYEKSRKTHDISLIVTSVIQNAVYVVMAGKGKILLIRSNTMAALLEQTEGEDILSASGFLEPDDLMILETQEFSEKVPNATLLETLTTNTVADAAEILSPTIHKEQTGAEAALLFSYHSEGETQEMAMPQPVSPQKAQEQEQEGKEKEAIEEQPPMYNERQQAILEHAMPKKRMKLSHRQKIFLTIAVIVAVVLVGTIFLSLRQKQSSQNAALFASVYTPAQQKYQEGLGLKDLNASLAHDDFVAAQKMLNDAKPKFSANSSEEKQILALLDKVNAELPSSTASNVPATDVAKAAKGDDPFMDFMLSNSSVKYFATDSTNYFYADNTGITRVNLSTNKSTQVIKNSTDWKTLGGFETYLGNMYVVDTADGIDKYSVTASGFGNKTAYFTNTAPDLSKIVSMAIDGSVWLLGNDGSINKYTKGKADSFSITGLTSPLSTPTQIVTTVDDDNAYVLDNGNGRIVVIKKDSGAFVAEYHNDILKSASQIDVSEKNKTVFILSSGSIYKMNLK